MGPVAGDSARGRWILAAAVLGSGMAFLDGTVVNVALRVLGTDLDASVTELQWVVNAYLLALASLILLGGSLGDRFGRRRLFLLGVAGFAVTSVACGLAREPEVLVVARLLQGVSGALLTPSSLALLQSSLRREDRAAAIGRWSGLTSLAVVVGPLLGGWLVEVASWRWIFFLNVPLAAAVLLIGWRHLPESSDPDAVRGFDGWGALLSAAALAGVTWALTETGAAAPGWLLAVAAVGVVAGTAFVLRIRRTADPLVPPSLFADRVFSIANTMTLLVYGALGAMTFFLTLQLQVGAGWSPLQAGLATLPMTVLMILLSGRSGTLAARIGPRWQLSVGPLLCALGTLLLVGVGPGTGYLTGVLPGVLVFGLGLTALVAPLTASVLAAAPDRYAGVASGINNAVARSGGLLAVAALPSLVGLTGADYQDAATFTPGYRAAQLVCVVLLVLGGLVSFVGLRRTGGLLAGPAGSGAG
ncbi:MFS transporter [Desertihabitans brevis]|uniref:MFS transporter n=1 Tax=Desertihabitans brevis TaxID=2268447 RepID=A0A367YT25_9ACTN|nr:MFS transporter [Desertihabitans brevis]RCK68182.1 MFS transporter [Desertihabitans brevis]